MPRELRKKIPSIRVGFIRDIKWTNGNRLCPTNPISTEVIESFTLKHNVKINWSDNNNGVVKLSGHYNYLVYDDGEYFFLEKIKVFDIDKEIFLYSVIRDIKQYYLSYTQLEVKGSLCKSNQPHILWEYLQRTQPLINEPNSANYYPTIKGKSIAIKGCVNFRVDQFAAYWVTKQDLKNFLDTFHWHSGEEKFARLTYKQNKPFQIIAQLPLRRVKTFKDYIAKLLNKFIATNEDDLKIANATDIATRYGALNNILKNKYGLRQALILKKFTDDKSRLAYGTIFTAEIEKKSLINFDFSEIDDIELISEIGQNLAAPPRRNLFELIDDSSIYHHIDQNVYELKSKVYADVLPSQVKNYCPHVDSKQKYNLWYSLNTEKLKSLGLNNPSKSNYSVQVNYYPSYLWNTGFTDEIRGKISENNVIPYDTKLGFILFGISKYNKTLFNDHYSNAQKGEPHKSLTSLQFVTGLNLTEVKDQCDTIINLNDANKTGNPEITFQEAYGHFIDNHGIWFTLNTYYLNGILNITDYLTRNIALSIYVSKITCNFIGSENTLITKKNAAVYNLNDTALPTPIPKTSNPLINSELEDFKNKLKRIEKRREQIEIVEEKTAPGFSVEPGDTFWSNVDFNLSSDRGGSVEVDTPILAVIYDKNRFVQGNSNYAFRFGVIQKYDFNLSLSKEESNLIRNGDYKQLNKDFSSYYPWVFVEKKFLDSYKTYTSQDIESKFLKNNYDSKMSAAIDELLDDLLKCVDGEWSRLVSSTKTNYCLNSIHIWNDRGWWDDYDLSPDVQKTWTFNQKNTCNINWNDTWKSKIKKALKINGKYRWLNVNGRRDRFLRYVVQISDDDGNQLFHIKFYPNCSDKGLKSKWHTKIEEVKATCSESVGAVGSRGLEELYNKTREPSSTYVTKFSNSSLIDYLNLRNAVRGGGYLETILYELGREYATHMDFKKDSNGNITYGYFTEEILKKQNKPSFFYLKKNNTVVAIAAMQWFSGDADPVIEIIMVDQSKIEFESYSNLTVKPEDLTLTNIAQAINQKNVLYIYGQKYPIQTRLATQNGVEPFDLDVLPLEIPSTASQKYRVKFSSTLDYLDEIITVQKQITVSPQQNISVVDIEQLKIMQEERLMKKQLDLEMNSENRRLLYQTQNNRVDDFNYLKWKEEKRVANTVAGSAMSAVGNVVGGMIGGSMAGMLPGMGGLWGIGSAMRTLSAGYLNVKDIQRESYLGKRGVDQGAIETDNQIRLAKNQIDNTHYFQELHEKQHILQMANNSSNWVVTEGDEIRAINSLLLGDKDSDIAIINKLPTGELLQQITDHYERHGTDVFIPFYTFNINDINRDIKTIVQFQAVDSLTVEDYHTREQLKALFLNGVVFLKVNYEVITEDRLRQYKLHLAEIEARKKKLEEKKIEERQLKLEELKAAEEVRQKVLNNLNILTDELNELKDAKEKLEKEKESLQADLEKEKQMSTSCATSLSEVQASAALQEEELKQTKATLKTAQASVTQLQRDKTQLQRDKTAAEAETTKALQTINDKVAEINRLKAASPDAQMQNELIILRRHKQVLINRIKNANNQLVQYESDWGDYSLKETQSGTFSGAHDILRYFLNVPLFMQKVSSINNYNCAAMNNKHSVVDLGEVKIWFAQNLSQRYPSDNAWIDSWSVNKKMCSNKLLYFQFSVMASTYTVGVADSRGLKIMWDYANNLVSAYNRYTQFANNKNNSSRYSKPRRITIDLRLD